MISLIRNRIEFLDPVFRILHYFDSPYFFFILIPIVWLGYSYRWGLRLLYWMTFSNILNTFLKLTIGWPRPSSDLPELAFFHPKSPGFPSGAAQTSLFLGGLLIYYWRTPAAWIIGSIYVLLLSFSRLYLGVHYPLDILGGWMVGAFLFFLFIKINEPIEKWLAKKGLLYCLFLSLLVPAAVMLFIPNKGIFYTMGAAMGVGIGTYFSLKNHLFLPPPKTFSDGATRSAIGIAVLFTVFLLWPWEASFFQSFAIGIFVSLAASPICRWMTR